MHNLRIYGYLNKNNHNKCLLITTTTIKFHMQTKSTKRGEKKLLNLHIHCTILTSISMCVRVYIYLWIDI